MKTDEMTSILEATNPTARCTAIRTLRQIEHDRGGRPSDDELVAELEDLIATDEGD